MTIPPDRGAPLTSSSTRVKEARKLSRRSVRTERRLFLADGPKAVEGALSVPGCVVEVFATQHAADRYADQLAGANLTLVDDRALSSLSDSVTPAGVVAVCRFPDTDLDGLIGSAPATALVVVCAEVRDPGNAGTIIRTADAVGADGVLLAGHSVDAYNPKTVRASVGSLFHLPVVTEVEVADAVRRLQRGGFLVLAADGAGESDLFDLAGLGVLDRRIAWLFGNEARGLPDDVAALADHRVAIPLLGRAESLNLSTAAAVCLYESARVRRT